MRSKTKGSPIVVPLPKPRNPVAVQARQRKAGSHQKPSSDIRLEQKRALKRLLDET